VIVSWKVEGWIKGPCRSFEIEDDEFEYCETEEEKNVLIERFLEEEFRNTVYPYVVSKK
jgi:hypothetical protein